MSDAETERSVLKAIRKHLRDSDLAAAVAWLKKCAAAREQLERLT